MQRYPRLAPWAAIYRRFAARILTLSACLFSAVVVPQSLNAALHFAGTGRFPPSRKKREKGGAPGNRKISLNFRLNHPYS